jgi:ADP-ribose pyrophosphatase YjhB (NUDIX family)
MKTFGTYPTDEKIEEIIKRDFKEETGLEALEVSHIFPMDRGITIHTETRTWHGKLTWSARKIEKGTLEEEV